MGGKKVYYFHLVDENGRKIAVWAKTAQGALKTAKKEYPNNKFRVVKNDGPRFVSESEYKTYDSQKVTDFFNRVLAKMQDGRKMPSFSALKDIARRLKAEYDETGLNGTMGADYYWTKPGNNWSYKVWEKGNKWYCNFRY